MRHASWLVFDEYLQSTSPVGFTSQDLNSKLGMYDQLAIQAVVDNVTGAAGGFTVQIYHSSDGRNWLAKSATAEIGGSPAITLVANSQMSYFGYDTGTIPSLGLVQLKVSLGASSGAHVRVYVTGRDGGGS